MSDNFEKYKGTINGIYRETKEALWTTQFATLVLLLFAILFLTIVVNAVFFSFGGWFMSTIIYLVEAIVPLTVLYFHQQKIFQIVREKVSEMEATNPGMVEAYEDWRARVDNSGN
jgi:uncharacterized membrane protein